MSLALIKAEQAVMTPPDNDPSEGYDAITDAFMAARSNVGANLVRAWARARVAPGGAMVDVGCGSGEPITRALVEEGFTVFGIDAAPAMIEAFRRRLPAVPAACEPAQSSAFFGRTFDGAVAIGLLFLLSERDQVAVIRRLAWALRPGGRLLFTAPKHACTWPDALTGRPSQSLGAQAYTQLLELEGLSLLGLETDDGGNTYFDCERVGVPSLPLAPRRSSRVDGQGPCAKGSAIDMAPRARRRPVERGVDRAPAQSASPDGDNSGAGRKT